mgnify:CR=1 FL=1
MKAVDSACYVAKEKGRNLVHVSRPDDKEIARHHGQMQWMQRIQRAIEEDEFVLYSQTIRHSAPDSRDDEHLELLLRMVENKGTENERTIPPSAFLPAAERYHLMPSIDRWVLDKALHTLDDGRVVESVLMRYPARGSRRERTTLCISSQAGCAVGCPFCATGELGLWRDLRTAEIIDQARFWRNELAAEGRRLSNIVFMGMGEPLLNPDAVLAACAALSDGNRFGLGQRHITVSTSGVIPGIERMTSLRRQYKLAVSLHAARPELRDVLVPLNRKYPIAELLQACSDYVSDKHKRTVTFEYTLIDGVKESPEEARKLVKLLRRVPSKLNLIPFNPFPGTEYRCSPESRILEFQSIVMEGGLIATVRKTRGQDIDAACGQLAGRVQDRTRRSRMLREQTQRI